MQLAVARDNARFFGTLVLKNRINDAVTLAVGVRNSIDKSFPIGLVTGTRCFVCDNLAFQGEIVIARRHTRFGEVRFQEAISKAVLGLHEFQATEAERIGRLQAWYLTDDQADAFLLRAFEKDIVSSRLLPAVIKEWREPSYPEFRERSAFSFLNAFTSALKDRQKSNPQEAALATIRLQRLLSPPITVQCTEGASYDSEN